MNTTFSLSPRRLLTIGALGLVAAATVGYANSNTVPGSNAGDGTGTVSGYTVSNIHYTLDSTNPANATSVSFNTLPVMTGTSTRRISLDNGANWLPAGNCTGTAPVVCTLSGATVLSLTTIRLVAAD